VHVADVARAFRAVLEADRELVHNEAFNVGSSAENYRIRDVAEIVRNVVPGSTVAFANDAFDDPRNYRVNCDKLTDTLPAAQSEWTVRRGVEELLSAYLREGLTLEDLEGSRFGRVRRVRELLAGQRLDADLRWTDAARRAAQ
jgi:nucleoside-diphosphate-sugar epimerase